MDTMHMPEVMVEISPPYGPAQDPQSIAMGTSWQQLRMSSGQSRVISFSTDRGRDGLLDNGGTGTATIVLDNSDGALDEVDDLAWINTRAGFVGPMTPIRVRMGGAPVFTGYIVDGFQPEGNRLSRRVTVRATDWMAWASTQPGLASPWAGFSGYLATTYARSIWWKGRGDYSNLLPGRVKARNQGRSTLAGAEGSPVGGSVWSVGDSITGDEHSRCYIQIGETSGLSASVHGPIGTPVEHVMAFAWQYDGDLPAGRTIASVRAGSYDRVGVALTTGGLVMVAIYNASGTLATIATGTKVHKSGDLHGCHISIRRHPTITNAYIAEVTTDLERITVNITSAMWTAWPSSMYPRIGGGGAPTDDNEATKFEHIAFVSLTSSATTAPMTVAGMSTLCGHHNHDPEWPWWEGKTVQAAARDAVTAAYLPAPPPPYISAIFGSTTETVMAWAPYESIADALHVVAATAGGVAAIRRNGTAYVGSLEDRRPTAATPICHLTDWPDSEAWVDDQILRPTIRFEDYGRSGRTIESIVNRVYRGETMLAESPTSVERYGERTYDLGPGGDDPIMVAWGNEVISARETPRPRYEAMRIDLTTQRTGMEIACYQCELDKVVTVTQTSPTDQWDQYVQARPMVIVGESISWDGRSASLTVRLDGEPDPIVGGAIRRRNVYPSTWLWSSGGGAPEHPTLPSTIKTIAGDDPRFVSWLPHNIRNGRFGMIYTSVTTDGMSPNHSQPQIPLPWGIGVAAGGQAISIWVRPMTPDIWPGVPNTSGCYVWLDFGGVSAEWRPGQPPQPHWCEPDEWTRITAYRYLDRQLSSSLTRLIVRSSWTDQVMTGGPPLFITGITVEEGGVSYDVDMPFTPDWWDPYPHLDHGWEGAENNSPYYATPW